MAVNKITKQDRKKKKRPGVVAKTRSSNHKHSKTIRKIQRSVK